MNESLNIDEMKYIIGSVLKYGYESIDEAKNTPHEFNEGRKQAYYEVLDTIYSRLLVYEQDPKEFGYSENWEKEFWAK